MTTKKFIAICTRLLKKYQLSFQRNLFSISSISQKAMCASAQNALYFLCVHWREDCRGKVCTDNLRMQKMRSESLQGERLLWSLPSKIWGVDWLYRSPPFADVLARNSNLVLLLIKVFNDYQIGWKAVGLYEYLSWKSNERDSISVRSRNMKEVGLGTHFWIQEFSSCTCMCSTLNTNLF